MGWIESLWNITTRDRDEKTTQKSTYLALVLHWPYTGRNGSILGVVSLIYQNTVGNLNVQICLRCQPSHQISRTIEGATLKITQIFFHYIMVIAVVPSSKLVAQLIGLNVLSKGRYIGQQGQSGKAIIGIPGYLPGSGRQLPEIDIKICFIMQVFLAQNNSGLSIGNIGENMKLCRH